MWLMLYNHGASSKKEDGTRQFWNTLTREQQEQVYASISLKLEQDMFVHYDPVQAIKENLRGKQVATPQFLKGNEGGDLVQVKYRGLFKICTRETMNKFKLEFVKDWKPRNL